jgi:hypothetical protein
MCATRVAQLILFDHALYKDAYLPQYCAVQSVDALMIEAIRTSETSVNFYQTTRRNIPQDSPHHTRSLENLKYHEVGVHSPVYALHLTRSAEHPEHTITCQANLTVGGHTAERRQSSL